MESIYIQNAMKGQGSLELALEMKKETKKIDWQLTIFEKSGSCVLDGFYKRSWAR